MTPPTRSSRPPLPPPYETTGGGGGQRRRHNPADDDKRNETTPKSADPSMSNPGSRHHHHHASALPASGASLFDSSPTKQLYSQADEFNKRHTCVPPPPPLSRQQQEDQHLQFVNSLAAPRRWWFNHVTVEPLAFLAILALFIEFPSIQDLIYTKVCLQVVSNHPNLTQSLINHHRHSAALRSPLLNLPPTSIPQLVGAHSDNDNIANTSPLPRQTRQLSSGPTSSPSPLIVIWANHSTQSINPSTPAAAQQLSTSGRIQQPADAQVIDSSTTITSGAHFLCDRFNKSAIPQEIRQEIAAGDSLFWLKYELVLSLLCVLSCPYWGGLSDKIGRLIPMNVPIVAAILSNLLSLAFGLLISLDSHTMFDLNWLYVGAVLTGLSGGQAVIIMNSFGFISDNTSSQSRSKRVAVLESVIYLSHSAGFYITKHIMSLGLARPERPWLNRHFVAFLACAMLNLICVIYTMTSLRHRKFHRLLNNFEREQQESFGCGDIMSTSSSSILSTGTLGRLDSTDAAPVVGRRQHNHGTLTAAGGGRAPGAPANADRLRELTSSTPDDLDGPIVLSDKAWTDWGALLTVEYYKQTYETVTKPRESRALILMILSCGCISAMSLTILMSLLYVYLRTDPFNWSTGQYSQWNSITSITRGAALVSLTLGMKFIQGWNVPDPLVAALGFLGKGLGLGMIAIAQSSTLIYWSLLAFVPSEFSMPPIRSLLSKLVVREEVGKVYSCLATLQSVCFLFGNIIFYLAYTSLELQDFFRLSFLVVALFQFGAVIIMLLAYSILRRRVIIVG